VHWCIMVRILSVPASAAKYAYLSEFLIQLSSTCGFLFRQVRKIYGLICEVHFWFRQVFVCILLQRQAKAVLMKPQACDFVVEFADIVSAGLVCLDELLVIIVEEFLFGAPDPRWSTLWLSRMFRHVECCWNVVSMNCVFILLFILHVLSAILHVERGTNLTGPIFFYLLSFFSKLP
jgi:hypothetical protein